MVDRDGSHGAAAPAGPLVTVKFRAGRWAAPATTVPCVGAGPPAAPTSAMPDPVATPIAANPLVTPTAAAELTIAAAGFAAQLRAASPGQTVSLGAMVTAHAGAAPAAAAGVLASAGSVGLGAMGAVVGASGVTRVKTGDEARIDKVVNFALAQQGKPYVFGTRGPDTYDCSGLMTAAYEQIGVDIPAYTFTQATKGREVDPSTEPIKAGDLIFVRGGRPATDLGHVGMAISATEWIQAPRTGDVVKTGPLPYDRIQVVRRLVGP